MRARSTYAPYNCTVPKVINSVCGRGRNSEVKTVYDQISNAMQTYSVLPTFVSSLNALPPTSEMPPRIPKSSKTVRASPTV